VENPYWHPFYKPHTIDFDEIQDICFKAFCIFKASQALEGFAPEGVIGPIYDMFFQSAEMKLNAHLLDLAVRMRTFEDVLSTHEMKGEYDEYIRSRLDHYDIGSLGASEAPADRQDLAFRDACNKIIHAEDVRYVYNGSNAHDDDYSWGMTGIVEISGKSRGREWDVWLSLEDFLPLCTDIAQRFDSSASDNTKYGNLTC
jgi:hypothetical protein